MEIISDKFSYCSVVLVWSRHGARPGEPTRFCGAVRKWETLAIEDSHSPLTARRMMNRRRMITSRRMEPDLAVEVGSHEDAGAALLGGALAAEAVDLAVVVNLGNRKLSTGLWSFAVFSAARGRIKAGRS